MENIRRKCNIDKGETIMKRADIITTVGRDFLTDNIENGEFSYEKPSKR